MFTIINKCPVPVIGDFKEIAIASQIFTNWRNSIDPKFIIKSINIQSVDLVGLDKPRVLFMKLKADVIDKNGKFIPGVVFMRGGSIGVLVTLNCKGRYYTILTLQPRFPSGKYNFPEIPAGMLDGDGCFSGVAAKEIKEETGLIISEKDLIDLTEIVYKGKWKGVYPSAGGCDEFLRLFVYQKEISSKDLEELKGKCTGNLEEGENITLKIIQLKDLVKEAPDSKALSALSLYNYLKDNKKGIV